MNYIMARQSKNMDYELAKMYGTIKAIERGIVKQDEWRQLVTREFDPKIDADVFPFQGLLGPHSSKVFIEGVPGWITERLPPKSKGKTVVS